MLISNLINKPYLVILVSIFIFSLVAPMLFFNIRSDPRLIPYFDPDEGYSLGLAWYYYSGQKSEIFQASLDHGIELQTIVDLLVRPLSLFIQIDEGIVLFVIRLFHFISGMLALFFLWRFLKRHFPSSWIPTVGTLVLLLSPYFVWLLDHIKEEPFLILLIILGLDYTLRIIEDPSWKNLIFATFFAAAAFAVKLVGLFLLPGILLSLYLVHLAKEETINIKTICHVLKNISFILISILIILVTFLLIIIPIGSRMYFMMRTEHFDLEQFASSFKPPKDLSFLINACIGICIIFCILIVLWLYRRDKLSSLYKRISIVPLFTISFAVVAYRWLFNPFGVIISRARWLHQQKGAPLNLFTSSDVIGCLKLLMENIKGWVVMLMRPDILGITGIILIFLYFIVELSSKSWRTPVERIRFFKRLIILMYCIIFLLFIFLFQSRHSHQHLITINVLLLISAFDGMRIIFLRFGNKRWALFILTVSFLSIIIINFWQHGFETVQKRIDKFNQKNDIVFAIGDWFKNNYPYDTKIVADAPMCVYIPSEFKNVVFVMPRLFLDLSYKMNPEYLKKIIENEKPRLIFYNRYVEGKNLSPPVEQFLEGVRLRKLKAFRQGPSRGGRSREDNFEIYELY